MSTPVASTASTTAPAVDLALEVVDPHDDAALDAWHAAYLAAERHGRPETASPWQRGEVAAEWRAEQDHTTYVVLAGRVDGVVVVTGLAEMPLHDNRDHAWLAVHTVPGARRHGHGTAMLARLEEVARAHGRTILDAEASYPYAAPADGSGHPGPDFLVRHGFRCGLGDVHRELALPVDAGLLDRLADEAAPHHTAYTFRSFVGPVPDDIVESFARIVASLPVEAPTGDLELEPETADVGVLRQYEALAAAQGRTKYNTVALDASGEVVAYSELATTVHEPGRAYQWGTLVRRADRGHRLGLALKVANLRLLAAHQPEITRLTTYNAEVNAHMVGVNERMGFRPVERLGEFQKRLDA